MFLITDAQRQQLLDNGAARARQQVTDPYPVVKLYTPDAGAVWLLTELAADGNLAFGLCDAGLGAPELAHVALSDLEKMRGPRGLAVVPDSHFAARQPLSAYYRQALRDGSIKD